MFLLVVNREKEGASFVGRSAATQGHLEAIGIRVIEGDPDSTLAEPYGAAIDSSAGGVTI
jgi:hypothetical protein